MQARRKTRLYIVLAVLAGLGLTVSLTLYALSTSICSTPRGNYLRQNGNPGATIPRAFGWGATFSRAPAARPANPRRFLPNDARGVVTPPGIIHGRTCSVKGRGVVGPGVLDGERHGTAFWAGAG